jgi:hypothetical protein
MPIPKPAKKETKSSSGSEIREKGLLSSVITGKIPKPPRVLIYGVHGIGKSSLAASAPNAIFIPTEEGADEIDVAKFPVAESQPQVLEYLRTLYADKHDYQTVVIDSVDWLEDEIRLSLTHEYTEKELAFGKDSLYAEERLGEVLTALNALRSKRSMTCIMIAHSEIRRFDSPLTEPYDRYQPKLQQRFSALLQEWADAVLFTGYDVTVVADDKGFNKKSHRGVGVGERRIFTEERPGYLAKNRYDMPESLPMLKKQGFDEIAQYVPYLRNLLQLAEPKQ